MLLSPSEHDWEKATQSTKEVKKVFWLGGICIEIISYHYFGCLQHLLHKSTREIKKYIEQVRSLMFEAVFVLINCGQITPNEMERYELFLVIKVCIYWYCTCIIPLRDLFQGVSHTSTQCIQDMCHINSKSGDILSFLIATNTMKRLKPTMNE